MKWAAVPVPGQKIFTLLYCRPLPRAGIVAGFGPGVYTPGFTLAPASQAKS